MTIYQPTVLALETDPMTATDTTLEPSAATEGTDVTPDVVMDGCPEYWIG